MEPAPDDLTASLILPPAGLLWQDLVGVLRDIPLESFLRTSPGPFLVEVREPVQAAVSEAGAGQRLRVLGESPELLEAHVHYLAVRGRALVVGRLVGCDVVLDDKTVSKQHAELVPSKKDWRVVDLEAANGTFLEGGRLPTGVPTPIESRSLVGFASYRCLFLSPEDLHALSKIEPPPPLQEGLAANPAGHRLRDLVRFVATMEREEFLSRFEAAFLLQVPVEADLPDLEREPSPSAATLDMSRSRILTLQRSKKVREARIHVLSPRKGGVTVGRSESDSDVVLPERSVSKRHAHIERTPDGWILVDLGSHNGTYVEGHRADKGLLVDLAPGHKLSFSSYRALFLTAEQLYEMASQIRARQTGRVGRE